jgi:hypothetical protein
MLMDANGGVKLMLYFATLKPSLVSLVSINGDTPIAGWPIRENPTDMDDDWGYSYDLGNHHICISEFYGLMFLFMACENRFMRGLCG